MSYCVNCGVELDDSAKKCALCDTPVLNPNKKQEEKETVAPFAQEQYIPMDVKKKFVAGVISLIIAISNVVCILTNVLLFKKGFWSFYILWSSLLLWVIFIFPVFMKKTRKFLMWAFDSVSVGLYVAFWLYMSSAMKLFYTCALPILLFASFLVLIYMLWVTRKKRNSILKVVFICIDIALCALASGSILYLSLALEWALAVGVIIFLCIVAVIVFLSFCYRSKTVRDWLSKKLFV